MEAIIIGSGTGVPNIRRCSPSIFLKIGEINLLFDSGPGAIRKLLEAGITYHEIDHIFYTHLHTDHVADLPAFLFAGNNPCSLRTRELHIFGPEGIKNIYDKFIEIYGSVIAPQDYQVNVKELREETISFGGYKITVKKMLHAATCLGYRIENNNKIFVYSGDTDFCENIIELSKDADALVLECAFPDEMKANGHLTPSLAGKIARQAGCKKLILTHLYPVCQPENLLANCKKEFKGQLFVAEDLMRIKI